MVINTENEQLHGQMEKHTGDFINQRIGQGIYIWAMDICI